MNSRVIYTGFLTLAFLLPALEWIRALDIPRLADQVAVFPPGQSFYLAAKLLGMTAMSVALVQIGLSALARARLVRMDRNDHRVLGGLIVLLVLAHVGSFVTGVSIRNEHVAWNLFVPNLTHGSYNRGVGMGIIGFWLLLAGAAVPLLRGLMPRIMHRLALLACGLGLVHAVWIGTEKTYIWALVGAFGVVFAIAAVRRLGRRQLV